MTKDPILAHREESNMRKGGGKKRKQVARNKDLEKSVDFNAFRSKLEQKYGNLIRCWYKWGKADEDNDKISDVLAWDDFRARMAEEGFQEKLVPHSTTWDLLNCGKRG